MSKDAMVSEKTKSHESVSVSQVLEMPYLDVSVGAHLIVNLPT